MKPPAADVTRTVHTAIQTVLADSGRAQRPIEPVSQLAADLGLDSLDLAQTVVLLERSLGIDPFRAAPAAGPRPALRTVSDLVAIYSAALDSTPS